MAIFSRKNLTEAVARSQIESLSKFDHERIRPDKWSDCEPIDEEFKTESIQIAAAALSKPHGAFLYRKGTPVHVSGEIWNLKRPPSARFASGPFSNYWTARFDLRKIAFETVELFVEDMFCQTAADFAFLTTSDDLTAKNKNSDSFSYKGLSLESGIPGLYWLNFFSKELGEWLGISSIDKQLANVTTIFYGAFSVKFGDSPADCRTFDVLQKQWATIRWLGADRFFDINNPSRKIQSLDWHQVPLPQCK